MSNPDEEVTRPDSVAPFVPEPPMPEVSEVHERRSMLPGDMDTLSLILKQVEAIPVILEECKAIRLDYAVAKKINTELFDEIHRYRHEIEKRVTAVERRVTVNEYAIEDIKAELDEIKSELEEIKPEGSEGTE